jgi:signal peptidase II
MARARFKLTRGAPLIASRELSPSHAVPDPPDCYGETVNEPSRPAERRSPLAIALLLFAVAAGVAADLGTKEWAIQNLAGERLTPRVGEICVPGPTGYMPMDRVRRPPVVIVPGLFEMRYAENCGAAFGVMNTWSPLAKRLVFFPVALGAVLVLGTMFVRGRGGRFLAFAVPLIISGAIGNFVDRLRYGYVVDFIRFYGETPEALRPLLGNTWEYPTFNVADIAITLGVAFLLIDGWLEGKREREAEAAEATAKLAPGDEDASDAGPTGHAAMATAHPTDAAPSVPPAEGREPSS